MSNRFTPRRAKYLLALALAALAGCGASSPPAGNQGEPAASSPAPATWTPGGSYTGTFPVSPMPGPAGTLHLRPYTTADGYTIQDDIVFGVPLHYAIPNMLKSCDSAYTYRTDLPPGQYIVPFEVVVHNLTAQQAPGLGPLISITDGTGTALPGVDISQSVDMTWANGDCQGDVSHQLAQGGSDAMFGAIGASTPDLLSKAYVTVQWNDRNNEPAALNIPLHSLLAHQASSWLITHGGTS